MNFRNIFIKNSEQAVPLGKERAEAAASYDQTADPATEDRSVERLLRIRDAEQDLKRAIGGK